MTGQNHPRDYRWFLNKLTIPTAFFALCFLTYGIFIPRMGFFWDDWPTIWYYHRFGPTSFREVFLSDRPLLGWIFMITTSLFKESIIGWQIFGIFTRWLSGVALWWLLVKTYRGYKALAVWAGLLFIIYPGFTQQFVSVTYSHVFIYLTLGLISLGTMVVAVKNPRQYWYLYILSLILSASHLFSVEYFFGLELIRPLFIWHAMSEKRYSVRTRMIRTLGFWAPYLLITILFLSWTIFLHKTPRGEIQLLDDLANHAIPALSGLIFTIFQDSFEVTAIAWWNSTNFTRITSSEIISIAISLGISVLISGLVYLFLNYLKKTNAGQIYFSDEDTLYGRPYVFLGITALLTAGWPIWVTDLELKLRFPLDRFTLPMMLGACVLMCGAVGLIFKKDWHKNLIIAMMVGAAAGFHYRNALTFQNEWLSFKDFFWQLSWRAPGLEPNTTILTPELSFDYFSDNSLTAPLNWIYDPNNQSRNMNYLFFDLESRLGNDINDFSPEKTINHQYRIASFSGLLADTVLISYQPSGCLAVIDTSFSKIGGSSTLTPELIKLSNPDLIVSTPNQPAELPDHIFGRPPDPSWCFWYQKASLANQTGDWEKLSDYSEEASYYFDALNAANASELLPFIEGYVHTGEFEKALNLSKKVVNNSEEVLPAVCAAWNRIFKNPPSEFKDQQLVHQISDILGCK